MGAFEPLQRVLIDAISPLTRYSGWRINTLENGFHEWR